jgi:hypothetical protein
MATEAAVHTALPFFGRDTGRRPLTAGEVLDYLASFRLEAPGSSLFVNDGVSSTETVVLNGKPIRRFVNEYWTAAQRQAHSIHEVSYRACFKPQLPRFFIASLTDPGDTVYDPFAGRGTTAVEAALLGRGVISNDINPLSKILTAPRLAPPTPGAVEKRLDQIASANIPIEKPDVDLSMFYHERTLNEILRLRAFLRGKKGKVDAWIRMVATNRLTGHSSGFFSVYTMPPNQAVSADAQRKINEVRRQTPPYRNTRDIIMRKTHDLLRNLSAENHKTLHEVDRTAKFYASDARHVAAMKDASVSLTVTSPPFLDVVQYGKDNWLRCWFNGLDADSISGRITMMKKLGDWECVMLDVFRELHRVSRPGGWVAFEVGEVRNGKVNLDEVVAPLGMKAGFECIAIMVNQQKFTKTANCWGVSNNAKGTNTNRIVLLRKEAG